MIKILYWLGLFLVVSGIGTALYFWSVWVTFAWFVAVLAGLLIHGAIKRKDL